MLSALQAGNKGTQACITAATAVSGIIADLDTTIMFATAGTLNAENGETFADHRYRGRPKTGNHIGSPHPAQDSEMSLSTLISTRFPVGDVNHRVRMSSTDKLETAFPKGGWLFRVCLPGGCPSDCPQTRPSRTGAAGAGIFSSHFPKPPASLEASFSRPVSTALRIYC